MDPRCILSLTDPIALMIPRGHCPSLGSPFKEFEIFIRIVDQKTEMIRHGLGWFKLVHGDERIVRHKTEKWRAMIIKIKISEAESTLRKCVCAWQSAQQGGGNGPSTFPLCNPGKCHFQQQCKNSVRRKSGRTKHSEDTSSFPPWFLHICHLWWLQCV